MKTYDLRTKAGQRQYLADLEENYLLGFEDDEHDQKIFLEGVIQGLREILGVEDVSYFVNGHRFVNR